MSLFKILPWFSYQCPDDEASYGNLSMTCGRLSAGNELNDNIIVSSHSGYISILHPTAREGSTQPNENLEATGSHASVVYEAKLAEPILAVLTGNFLTYSQRQEQKCNNIAVLHPRKLVIYALVKSSAPYNEHGQQAKLQMLLQHDLLKSAFSFCKGSFGGVKAKEHICVMFLDGSLKFYEQDGISHNCILPGTRTIPTNMIYIARTDCFALISPSWDLECYRYLSLSESFERKFSPIWSVCLGEYILDLNSHQISNTESMIVLLGENNLICVSDTGKMRFVKKLDYTPLSFCSFVVGWHFEPGCKLMIAVATENGSLLIYNESTLVWCAELLDNQTISFQRGNFSGLAGGLVTLTATGKVTVGYLGSSPSIFKVPPMNLAKLDYYKSKTELEEMETEINSSVDNTDVQFINSSAEKDVHIKDVRVESESAGDGANFKLNVQIMTTIKLEQFQLIVVTSNTDWIVSEPVHFFKDPKPNECVTIESFLLCQESDKRQDLETYSDEVVLLVSYINKQGITRAYKRIVRIEPKLLLKRSSAQKEASFKVTLAFSGAMDMRKLLADLNIESSEQAIGLQPLNSDHNVTLISSKDSNRYRLQSNNMAALTLVLSIITNYVAPSNDTKGGKAATVNPIPGASIELFLSSVEKYHKLKQEIKAVIDDLSTKTIEMRLFERCFLTKMQEKSSAQSTAGIDLLLRESYNRISTLTNSLKDLKLRTRRLQHQIASLIYFMNKIVERVNLPSQRNREQLSSITRPTITDFQDMSWVEAVAPSVDFIFNVQQLRKNGQPYQNFSARSEHFSFGKLSKQLKFILTGIADGEAEKALIEETETEQFENDWSAKRNLILEEK